MINSFGPVYVYSLAYSLSPLFSLFSGEKKKLIPTFFGCNIPSLGPRSKQYFSACSPPPQQETQDSGWGAQGCGTDQVCSSYFVLPSTDCLLYSPFIPWRSLSVPADFPTVRGFFPEWGPLLEFSFLPGLPFPFFIPLLFLSSYLVTRGFFSSCPFSCPKFSTNVQQVLCKTCSICRCILDVLVRRDEFHILPFCHFDSSLSLICCSAQRTPPVTNSKSICVSQRLKIIFLLLEQPLWSYEIIIILPVPSNVKEAISSSKATMTHANLQVPQHFLGAQST